jgi:hypothetical protein
MRSVGFPAIPPDELRRTRFSYLATVLRQSRSDPAPCAHGLLFITTQRPLSSGDIAFRGYGHAKRASALAAAAINSVATIALVFINQSLTRLGKLYCHDESHVFRRAYD